MSGVDDAIAALAARQHGVFTSAQARAAGATAAMVRTRVLRGQWSRLDHGVLAVAGLPPSFLSDCSAATLATPRSAISGRAAAAMHGLIGFDPCAPEVTAPPGVNHRSGLAVVRERTEHRTTRRHGIPVATVDQTVRDLCGRVPYRQLERATDDLLVDRRLHIGQLEDHLVVASATRERGTRDLRRLVEDRADGRAVAESELEPHLHRLVSSAGLPPFLIQPALPWRPDASGRVDALIPDWRLIVEADGRRWHARFADFDTDRRRDAEALAAGYGTFRATWVMLTVEFERTLDLLRRVGAAR